MWTDTTRAQYGRAGLALPSDLTDTEWAILAPSIPPQSFMGRPRKWPMRRIVEAILYAARIAGVRTRRIALRFAPFNTLLLVSRTSNGFLGPFIAKRIEIALQTPGGGEALLWDLRIVLFTAACAVALGILLVPTGQRLFAKAITFFQHNRSTTRLILRSATPAGLAHDPRFHRPTVGRDYA